MDVDGTRTLVLAHPFDLARVAGTTVVLRALMRHIPALDPSTHTVYLDLNEEASPGASLTRMRAAGAGGLNVLGVNLHLERHEERSVELYEVCRREDVPAFIWVHDYWPHHEHSVRRLVEDLGATLLASSSTVRDALAGAGFPARVAQVGIALENLVIHERPPCLPAPFVVGSVGRLVPRKRHADVVRAFGRARLDGTAQLRLRLLPSLVYPPAADDALLTEVTRDADAVRASGGVVVIDSEPAVRQDYGAYGIYVCASRYEGLSLTPIESVYSGCPVLMSDIPAHREIACELHPDDPDDVLFAPGDVDALAGLLRDEARTGRRGARVRDRLGEVRSEIEARWSTVGSARALLDILDGDRAHGGPPAYGPPV